MADIISKAPITDAIVDQVIKANEIMDENSQITQGVQLRKLVKDLRDRLETEIEKSNGTIDNKVDKDGDKVLSDVNWTVEEKDNVQTAIGNFDTWSSGSASTEYVDGKITPLQTSIDGLTSDMNGVVKLLDAPRTPIVNKSETDTWTPLSILNNNGTYESFDFKVPERFYSNPNEKGFLRLRFVATVTPKSAGIVSLRMKYIPFVEYEFVDLGDGIGYEKDNKYYFTLFSNMIEENDTTARQFHIEVMALRTLDDTNLSISTTINGKSIISSGHVVDGGWIEADSISGLNFKSFEFIANRSTNNADIVISGLTAEMALLND
ncbi:hypothetical protein LZQ00_00705 [Sphingobacterium sp. SRCM116780]|uniref:hypothetical protein n=1 Tax=Sphingobacterium sp. SRCM116780 TaxID=2907623 RepID=UPI001F1B9869|nr:hypothetical protein [Sphingobacterium sp. SRCM116780]UIR56362.1 hypothetical protein LZQ00_00705 [Sphingobacterium sp. SRCM116780]